MHVSLQICLLVTALSRIPAVRSEECSQFRAGEFRCSGQILQQCVDVHPGFQWLSSKNCGADTNCQCALNSEKNPPFGCFINGSPRQGGCGKDIGG
ncbi:hypothetical protein EJ03DRAFT_204261 [Teratosphaeria nubilosa]|uniref:Extracellular membrane protein CFEM domain-containing protein n=1 Tax=Teratosphaeria nubilosa TaxID=161662 RepID=A0A6G1LIP3_9PEZI|nr:hypothetical protein EJ03DRAFT_204261 [Teratosphaeria nubilosa]